MVQHKIYFFDKAYGKVPVSEVKNVREELIAVISPGRISTFYKYLSCGCRDIRLPLFEAITEVFVRHGIPAKKVWRTELIEGSLKQESV